MQHNTQTGRLMLAGIIILLALLGTGVMFLCNAGATGFFMRRHPQGEAAMGLVVPFFALIIAALALTLASVLAGFASGSRAVSPWPASGLASGLLVAGVGLGVALAGFMAFAIWAEPVMVTSSVRSITRVFGNLAGILGPLVLTVVLMFVASRTSETATSTPMPIRVMGWYLVAIAVAGYVLGVLALAAPTIARYRQARVREAEMSAQDQADRERARTMSVDEVLSEKLAKFSPEAPLWSMVPFFVASRGDRPLNDAGKRVLVERCLKVPQIDTQLRECMDSDQYIYARGACELVRLAPADVLAAHEKAWASAVETAIDRAAEAMTLRPAWLGETFDRNPDPLAHVSALLAAAHRFEGSASEPVISAALKRMAAAVNELTRDKKRDKLCAMLKQAGHPVPDEPSPTTTR